MKDPSQSNNTPSINSDEVVLNGHSHDDDNPFAEYMWMENEEEFNRQIVEELWRKNSSSAAFRRCSRRRKSMNGLFQHGICPRPLGKSRTNSMDLS
ncbi:polyadenylate-binding protein-interacting protein 2-like [Heterodontus francisci]|uniref:polyadenylate-binding protein-interacting protein 2-like n=1 Tax=Heterodontus francisci TaxID=7792 RepID=UPI00355ACF0A